MVPSSSADMIKKKYYHIDIMSCNILKDESLESIAHLLEQLQVKKNTAYNVKKHEKNWGDIIESDVHLSISLLNDSLNRLMPPT